jgi:hypothetical protein
MLNNLLIWILIIGKFIWEYDKFFSNQQFEKNLSESYHFILFSLIVSTILYKLHNKFFYTKKEELLESLYWIIFITAMGSCCSNSLGKDLTDFHYITYSLVLFYSLYIHKNFSQKKETFTSPKIIFIWLIVFKILWPPILYLWPFWPRKQRPYPEDLFDDWFDVDL